MKIRTALLLVPPALAVGLLAAAGSVHGHAFPYGAPPAHTGGFGEPTCAQCHAGGELNDPAGSLTVEGLPARYTPGQAYRLIVRLRRPQMGAAGFQLSTRTPAGAQAGTLAPAAGAAAAVQVQTADGIQYAGHTEPGSRLATPGAAAWTVVWTAPAAGPVTLHAAANAADDDHSPLGDYVYAAEGAARAP